MPVIILAKLSFPSMSSQHLSVDNWRQTRWPHCILLHCKKNPFNFLCMHPGRALRADLMTQQSRFLASITDRVKHILSAPRLHANIKSFHSLARFYLGGWVTRLKHCKTYGSLRAFGVWIDLVLRKQPQIDCTCHDDPLPPTLSELPPTLSKLPPFGNTLGYKISLPGS